MEDIKMKKKIMIGITIAAVVVIGFVGFCMWFLSGAGSTYYYAQIDNNKIEQGDSSIKGSEKFIFQFL